MALVEKSPFDANSARGLNVCVASAKRWAARMAPPVLVVAVTATLYRLFSTGHPILAIWTASAILAWLFVRGAGAATDSD